LSAGGFPVKLFPGINLPAILPPNPFLYALLHDAHRVMAWLLFFMVVGHLSAALLNAWVYRDGLFSSITWGRKIVDKSQELSATAAE